MTLPKEIERRFLIRRENALALQELNKPYLIEQSYLPESGQWQIRSRYKLRDGKREYTITMKRHSGHGECIEIEQAGTLETHLNIKNTTGKALRKSRSIHKLASGQNLELDVFEEDVLKDHAIAEVEVNSIDENLILPAWIEREVTGEYEYSNDYLFKNLSST